jgi:uncharacterized protein (TIGR02444 family)
MTTLDTKSALDVALLTPAEMAVANRLATEKGVSGPVLMEAAGRAVADTLKTRWSKRPVAVLCLWLQDNGGVNVNLILFAAYAGTRGVTLSEPQWKESIALVAPWHGVIIDRLRAVRREMKSHALENSSHGAQIEHLRAQVEVAELDAEWLEQARLDDWSKSMFVGAARAGASTAVAANIAASLRLTIAAGSLPDMPHRLMAAAERRSPSL